MSSKSDRNRPLRRLSKILFAALGGLAILLAVALGLFRLAVAQIPSYQVEIKSWVAEELGFAVDFSVLDARLGLTGPELTLLAASIGSGTEFLQADRATITLDPIALVLGRRIDISRLTLDGVALTVERDAEGQFRLGDFALLGGTADLGASIPQSVEVAIRDAELRYIDQIQNADWTFTGIDLLVEEAGEGYLASISLGSSELAGRLDVSVELSLPRRQGALAAWQLDANVDDVDLAAVARLLPFDGLPQAQGHGRADAAIEWGGGQLIRVDVGLDLEGLVLNDANSESPYDELSLNAEWRRGAAGEWQLSLDDVAVSRGGRDWATPAAARFALATDAQGVRSVSLDSEFLRLEDLAPLVAAFPDSQLAEQWMLFDPEGDVVDLGFALERRNDIFSYDVAADFDAIGVRPVGTTPGIDGISGRVSATDDSGTIQFSTERFATGEFSLDWPALFPGVVSGESLAGAVVWQQGLEDVQIFSSDLSVGLLGHDARASFDLTLPRDGSSPTIDLRAELAEVELVPAKQYLPIRIMPPAVVDWLQRSIVGGQGRDIEFTLSGPLHAFPFDGGEGEFRVAAKVENAALDYLTDWPAASNVEGWIEFLNAGFFAGATAGEALGNRARSFALAIADLRQAVLEIDFETEGDLENVVAYLRDVPIIADRLGPGFERIDVRSGAGSILASLAMPLRDRAAFELDAELVIADGELAIRGLRPAITEVNGSLRAEEDTVFASGIDGIFVGGPISVDLGRSQRPGYRAELTVNGETSVSALTDAFALPRLSRLQGQTLWRGTLLLPALDPLATSPMRFLIGSNLAGVAMRFPEPLVKLPSEPTNLAVELLFETDNRLEVNGNLGATRRFALAFDVNDDALTFTRGAVVFGVDEPRLPNNPGILVGGRIETLELDSWLALGDDTGFGQIGPLFLGADVQVAGFHAFGQQLGETALRIGRGRDDWQIEIDSEAIAGEISLPRDQLGRGLISADMRRVYLAAAGTGALDETDPRTLPGIRFEADEFGFGNRQLGEVSAVIDPVTDGLSLTEFRSRTGNFETEITGSWLKRVDGSRTSVAAVIQSSDVAAALAELGLDPMVEGEAATVTASIAWNSAPTADWLDHLDGDVSLFVETGTLREIDPGAGRVLGLMSIAALPRRLLLDFRDVFEEGFAFDEISGSFTLIDGNAYTNDLKFGGPAAEIGVVGRTGLRDHDYQQQIVVAPEPSNMLPTVGGLLGGAGVGAALLIFTRLFKEPLKGIGRASYCLTGSWDEPEIEPIDDHEPAEVERCADLPEELRAGAADE